MKSIFNKYVILFLLVTAISSGWALDSDQDQLNTGLKLSQSNTNIVDNQKDRVRFIPDNLFGVDFVDESHGWASGYYGTILKTMDGGRSWTHISLPHTDLIRRIQFLDKESGWLVTHRGRIMSSNDGGDTWKTNYLEDKQTNLRNIKFIDRNVGWAVGHEGTILYTDDGGNNWTNQFLSNYTGRDLPRLNGLTILSKTRAMLAGEFGVIAETTDAGKTWKIISSSDITATFTEIEQVNNSVLAVGLDGVVVQVNTNSIEMVDSTEDGKSTQIKVLDSGVSNHLFDIVSNKKGEGIVVGLANILKIKNGSQLNKVEINLPDRNYMYFMGATPISESKYVVVGAQGLVVTLDTENSEIKGLAKW